MQNTTWFTEARFGMFVHWGLYALPARHEWVMSREEIAPADYERYVRYFDPDRYDPVEWARAAADAGMRYVVLTTKHHEGFCLWDSALTDYSVMATPYGKDLIGPFVEAVRAAGLRSASITPSWIGTIPTSPSTTSIRCETAATPPP